MKSKKSISKNYLYNTFFQIFSIIVPLITTPYISRVLLPKNVGINSYVSSIVTLFTTIGLLGLSNYSIREIAYVRKKQEKLNKTFTELCILRLIFMFFTILIYLIYAYFNKKYYLFFIIYIFTILGTFVDLSWLFQGIEEMKTLVVRNFIIKLLSTISIFVFIKNKNDLNLLMFIYSITTLISSVSLYLKIPKYITKITFKDINIRKHIVPNLKLFLPQAATLIYCQFDKVMIEHLTSDISMVGFYNQAEKIVKIPLTIITSLSTVMLPRISENFINKKMDIVKKYINKAFKFSLLLAIPLTFGFIAISTNLVSWFLGDGYEEVSVILTLLSLTIVFISLSSVSGSQYLTATNNTKVLTISYVVSAVINLIVNYLLIGKYGACGAAIGTIIAEFMVFFIQIRSMKKIVRIRELFLYSRNSLIAGIIMFICIMLLNLLKLKGILLTLIQITIAFIIYFVILYILKDETFKSYLDRIIKKIKGGAVFK